MSETWTIDTVGAPTIIHSKAIDSLGWMLERVELIKQFMEQE